MLKKKKLAFINRLVIGGIKPQKVLSLDTLKGEKGDQRNPGPCASFWEEFYQLGCAQRQVTD